ncbi:nidogen-2 isoform X2 [Xiphophorus maculatus]|uniref:nidogen-2 isoform X2 n=1 Tax=Xiphophorus maculatus TaxID=8083 RepID=UPI000C6CC815|nr:nidogen-2 isoform X2 [Xiphophorus maculatus]
MLLPAPGRSVSLSPPVTNQCAAKLLPPAPAGAAGSRRGSPPFRCSALRVRLFVLPELLGLPMDRGAMLTAALLCCWSCTVCVVTAIRRTDLFPFGDLNGDLILPEGDDETSRALTLPRPFYFFDSPFSQLYVATNGIVSAQDLPMEKQYVDDGLPTDFPVVAPFLADIDTSGGRGNIYYRLTETPSVLNRFAQEVHRGFPDAKFTPTHAVVATWENVAAYEEQARATGATNKVNTFQTVIGYDETDSYVLFLYPEDGLNFFGTRPKESYNVEIEFPARVGFSRGEVSFFIISKTDGPFYSVAQDENSVKRLSQVGNTGVPGVWLFHTGKRFSFQEIIPASIGGLLAVPPTAGYGLYLDTTTPEYEFDDYNFEPESQEEVDAAGSPDSPNTRSEDSDRQLSYNREDVPLTLEPVERQYAPPGFPLTVPEGRTQRVEEQQPQVVDVYPPLRNPPPSGGHVVSVDEEDVDFDTGVIQYTTENKETCARFQQQCSQNAFCSDYATGFCCHCRPGFYGNGRHCLPDGAPQRVSGKVSGTVTVGSTPVELNNIDLHAYIVVGDGRAYTAISEVPEPVGWAMMSVSPVGELFGWLFALELPNSQAGFKITGAEFSRHAEVVFSPGNQRLSITQTGRGLDEHNHLSVDTVINGNVPFVPPGAEVTMKPFKETYQYYPSVATSSSVREFSVGLPEKASESYTFHLKQNITYRDCRHGNQAATPETLQINMERVFVMYVKEERILRYAITNKISPVGDSSEVELLNPCYAGNHDCDTTAQCIPLEGQAFRCQCATGYRGDGQNCYDIDECAEGLSSCGDYSQCLNLPGTHRCQCQSGFELGYESRTCVDIDECMSSPCHISAICVNAQASFQCQCLPGFYGDGFNCSPQADRLRSQCEQHRDSLQSGGQPSVGAYIPQCDSDGQYRPRQCHGSTGHCWCVDSRGQEKPETRTPPGTAPLACDSLDKPERPKTQCERHRDRIQTSSPDGFPLAGAYVPQCDENGQYRQLQCHSSTGYCWCVDSLGEERPGTRTPPGTPPTDCDKPERPKTHCEHHRDSVQTSSDGFPPPGAYIPQCDQNGLYLPEQCHGSTGHCWCVNSSGQERAGTRTGPGSSRVDCRTDEPERPKTHCEHHRDSVQTSSDGFPPPGAYIPQCDQNGLYLPEQCHGSTGHCWCVNSSGQERAGTRTGPGSPRVDCRTDQPERPKTPCEHHKERVQASGSREYPVAGAYVPQCDADGQYIPLQCHSSTGYCWCVNEDGQERAGTRTPPGAQPRDCVKPVAPKTPCEEQRDRAQASIQERYPVAGVFVPRCDAQGQFVPQQCHGSTGHCWCVDSSGQERAGTRTAPGASPVDCRKPAPTNRAESVCERWRASLIEHYGGNPDPQQYLPQCEPDGEFSPVQCYGESTYCWCVDQEGREVDGTRSHDAVKPACLPSVAPPIVRPITRPDVTPPAKTAVTLLYAQGQKIGALPLNGSRLDAERSKTLLTLHGSIVVGIAYDCKENKVYWTDLSARTINRASMASGAEPETLINTNLVSPEGLALDAKRRLMFWVDSNTDVIESASLDGSRRRTLFDSDLVNPRAIVVVSSTGSLYWTDWNREAPKIETSTVDGQGRRVVVSDGVGLPNALTYDLSSGQICWGDAGTKRLECISPNGSGRRVINSDLNYPFSMVYHSNHFYFSDWRRDGVIAVDKVSSKFTDEYLPEQRSHLYGITIATTHCLPGSL